MLRALAGSGLALENGRRLQFLGKTIDQARNQTASSFEVAYQKGPQETTTAMRTKLRSEYN